ncbi:MAG: hypothetical protein M3346_03915 [Actinomycetota bacterium]|nr:hypothetical protein [Actinomycetota bacterium]
MIKRFFVLTALVALLTFATLAPAGANHSWEDFHWARATNPISLEIVDSMTGEWDTYLPLVNADWNASSVINTTLVAGSTAYADRILCLPVAGKIRACNAENPDVTWLGLARVWLSGNHITQATTQVNDFWFNTDLYNDPSAKRHVLCQEIGHDFGLDHTYVEPSCMDDINGLFDPAFVDPGPHDYAQLETIYTHLDTGDGGGGGGCKGKKCQGSQSILGHDHVGHDHGGKVSTEIVRNGDVTVITFIHWAI